MVRSRLIAAALFGFGIVLGGACTSKQQNGQECLKSDDCESDRCIQYVCVDPKASHTPPTVADTGVAAEAATDGAGTEGGADSGTADTGTPDTGAVDTGTADDVGAG